jgi:two-component system response regulator HupR/HoxA
MIESEAARAEAREKPFVLCIDDDLAVLSSLRRLLREEPYEIATVPSVAQALSLIRHHVPDVIVTDERMPQSSGSQFLAEVSERWPWIGRVILTGYQGREIMNRSIRAGVDVLLYKPWDAEGFKRTLRGLVDDAGRNRGGTEAGRIEDLFFDLGGESG